MKCVGEASNGGHVMKNVLAIVSKHEFMRTLCLELENAGHRVISVDDITIAVNRVRNTQPDLVLVDLTLVAKTADRARIPRAGVEPSERRSRSIDGVGVCRWIRQTSDAPILVLTANLKEAEFFVEQESCADDFALIPSSPGQVLARIQTLLRWNENRNAAQRKVIRAGDVEVQSVYHQVTIAGQPVDMTRTELALLVALATEPGRALSRSELIGALKGNRSISERTIDSHIKNLRSKIEVDPCNPRRVLTVFGVGYKLSDGVIK